MLSLLVSMSLTLAGVGTPASCTHVTPILASQEGRVMAGNFRDDEGGCYVWLNVANPPRVRPRNRARAVCKLVLHEVGHLNGASHSLDVRSVMYSPFRFTPIPNECLEMR